MSQVKLISMTQPVDTELRGMSAEDLLGYIAKVSNPSKQTENLSRVILYCLRKKHWSPFQMVDLTFEIKTTRDIGRQILRHRSFEFQEFSQRYASPNKDDFETREARLQDKKNRQNSTATDNQQLADDWEFHQKNNLHHSLLTYDWAIRNNIAKEQARVVLPEGMTPTHMYMKGSLRSWIHYCQLRMGNGTQKEHQDVATEIWGIVVKVFPFLDGFIFPESFFSRFMDGMELLRPYLGPKEGAFCNSEHDTIYFYVTRDELDPASSIGKELQELGFYVAVNGQWCYDPLAP